jgi:hypothetical protein
MPKRKSTLLADLEFQVLPAKNGVPETYKCLCGAMEQFVAYRAALQSCAHHSYKCECCQVKRATLSSSRQDMDSGESTLAFLHLRSCVHGKLTPEGHNATLLQKRCLQVALDPLNKLKVAHMVPISNLMPLGHIQQTQCVTDCLVREKICQYRNRRRRLHLRRSRAVLTYPQTFLVICKVRKGQLPAIAWVGHRAVLHILSVPPTKKALSLRDLTAMRM